MRLVFLIVVLLSLTSVSQGQGFLDNVMNLFNRFNPFRPQQSSGGSPSPRPAPVFRPRPASVSAPDSMSAPILFSPPSQDSGPGPQPANFNFGRLTVQPIASPGRGNHNFEGKTFLLSWKEEGRPFFSWQEAKDYCERAGMRMISLDSAAKREHFLVLTASEGIQYFWTGGRLSPDKRRLTWENGASEAISQGVHPWSLRGLRGPQPDGQGAENCLAVLNNFYDVGLCLKLMPYHDMFYSGWSQVP